MRSTRPHPAIAWSLAGLILSVMPFGQAFHLRFAPAGEGAGSCHSCAAHAEVDPRAATGASNALSGSQWRAGGSWHQSDHCLICQFFATIKAVAVAVEAPPPSVPQAKRSFIASEHSAWRLPGAYSARAPPRRGFAA